MGFQEIFGNEPVKKILEHAIAKNRISNAYVFEGMPGIGKRLTAQVFACGLVCEQQENAPCGVCPSCKRVKALQHPDIVYVHNTKNETSIGVDDVREQIISAVYLKPYLSSRRVFIIGEGDMLSHGAQNALLKVLEEPPSYATFIICVTKQDTLLRTVLSRSHVLSFSPLSCEEVASFLEQKYGASEKTRLYARLSQGSIGVAQALLSDTDTERLYEDSITALLRLKKEQASVRETADFMIIEKDRISQVTDFFQTFLRDCVLIKSGMEQNVIYENKRSDMRVFCSDISKKSLVAAFDRLTTFKQRLTQNVNFNASVLETVVGIWEDFHG